MQAAFPIVALLAAALLNGQAEAQEAPKSLLATHAHTQKAAPIPPKAYLSFGTGPEFRLQSPVQRFWRDTPGAAGDLSRTDDRTDVTVATFALHF